MGKMIKGMANGKILMGKEKHTECSLYSRFAGNREDFLWNFKITSRVVETIIMILLFFKWLKKIIKYQEN